MHRKKPNTSSRSVKSQLTAISFITEEHATLKDSAESKPRISSETCCWESFDAWLKKKKIEFCVVYKYYIFQKLFGYRFIILLFPVGLFKEADKLSNKARISLNVTRDQCLFGVYADSC